MIKNTNKQIMFTTSKELYEEIEALAKEKGTSISKYVNSIVSQYIEAYKKKDEALAKLQTILINGLKDINNMSEKDISQMINEV